MNNVPQRLTFLGLQYSFNSMIASRTSSLKSQFLVQFPVKNYYNLAVSPFLIFFLCYLDAYYHIVCHCLVSSSTGAKPLPPNVFLPSGLFLSRDHGLLSLSSLFPFFYLPLFKTKCPTFCSAYVISELVNASTQAFLFNLFDALYLYFILVLFIRFIIRSLLTA